MNFRQKRKAERLARFGPAKTRTEDTEGKAGDESQQAVAQPTNLEHDEQELNIKPEVIAGKVENASETPIQSPEKTRGAGVEIVSRSEMRAQLRSITWKDRNRVPIHMTVSEDEALVEPMDGECSLMEEAMVVIARGMRHKSIRVQLKAAQVANQFARTVQMDDHKKLAAELRPTKIVPQNVTNIDARQDNRRVVMLIPDNGRD